MNYLVSMLLTQCFQQLYLRSDERYNGRLPVPVRVIQDEWANVAQPDSYPKVLATCRSYNIGINIIVQNIHSIKALYKDEWESVIGNAIPSFSSAAAMSRHRWNLFPSSWEKKRYIPGHAGRRKGAAAPAL